MPDTIWSALPCVVSSSTNIHGMSAAFWTFYWSSVALSSESQ
ncbi:MAG: hypothetical protein OJF50_002292 [Nitrospira sp.]|nr:hypothetical protein [Nitrospira sp.]